MSEGLRTSDPAVVARYLVLRSHFHDELLARVEQLIENRYWVQPTRRIVPTLIALVRQGFTRPGEGEVWPVAFLTAIDISLALCIQSSSDRLAGLGTTLNGPQRIRHRGWEDWWGWETTLHDLRPGFYDLPGKDQDEAALNWFTERLEWLVQCGLMRRK